jgi:hypothetical protein
MAPRYFTLAEANKTLPFVAKVVGDLVARVAEFRKLEQRRAELADRAADPAESERIEGRLFDLEGEIERIAAELTPIGCQLKDLDRGLLDFPARMGDDVINLCWLFGEKQIDWWHPLTTGFADRRPIAELPPETRGEGV